MRDQLEMLIITCKTEGVEFNAKNKQGWTPLVIAEGIYGSYNSFSPSTAALLRKLGAAPSPPNIKRSRDEG